MPEPERSIEELVDVFEVTTVTAALFGNSGAGGADHAKDKARDTLLRAVARLREENEGLREALISVIAHTGLPRFPSLDLTTGLLGNIARIANTALTQKGGDRE